MEKSRVFIPVDIFDKETVGIVSIPTKNDCYVKEQEGYFFPLPTRTLASLTKEERLSIGIGFSKKIENAEYRGYSDVQYFPEEIIRLCDLGISVFGVNIK